LPFCCRRFCNALQARLKSSLIFIAVEIAKGSS